MIKYFCFLLFSLSLFSQEVSIPTQFSQEGNLYKNLNRNTNQLTQSLTEFKENQKCFVIDFLGRDNYKVKFKDWEGIVKIDDLLVNEEMMDLYYDYQNKERDRLIADEEQRKKRILESTKKVDPNVLEQKRQDSILHVKAIEKKHLEAEAQERKLEAALREQKRQDSIAHVKAIEKKHLEAEAQKRKLEAVLREQKRQDSIAHVKAIEKKHLEAKAQERKLEAALREQKRQDSIAHVKAIEKKHLEAKAQERKLEAALREQRRQDSIFRVTEAGKKQVEAVDVNLIVNEKEEESRLERIKFRSTCHYIIDEYDDFYKKVYIRTEPYQLNKNLTVELYKYGQKECVFFNLSEDLGCASYLPRNRSSVKVILENNFAIAFYHSWDMDCGNFSFKANLSASQVAKLKESPIKSIRLKGTEESTTIIDIEYKEFFIDKLKCIE
ncbi:hypothetical protein [Thalassobellus sediminis]|uniref:hypothetical protein n=1 Tax=Thalassobellus sediminis TaxID=3367753 RepID=UPI00378BA306